MDTLKLILDFIGEHHPEAVTWTGDYSGFTEKPGDRHAYGYTGTVFNGHGCSVSVGHAVNPHPVYHVTAACKDGEIVWKGRIVGGRVEEAGYETAKSG
jgi:hypothetical protein